MSKEFNFSNSSEVYSMYKTVFKTIYAHIYCLSTAMERNENRTTIEYYASHLYNCTYVFEGYIDCLFDLNFINDREYNSFYEFVMTIRIECNYIMY